MSPARAVQRAALAGAAVLPVACAAASAQATPCIDTNSQASFVRRTMTIQQPGSEEIAVTGAVSSIDAAAGQIGLSVLGLDGEQRIGPVVIRLQVLEPSMAAQMPLPEATPLGPISAEFPLSALAIDRGVIVYPGCTLPEAGHEIAFTGILALGGGVLRADGFFLDYGLPAGGGEPDILGGKRG